MDLLIQANSRGIRYEGYDNDFIQCVFEDANVAGRSERYEFRCRPDLECCGRICCIPQENVIPIWLMTLFIILGLFLLFGLLGTMAWLFGKARKQTKQFDKAKKTRTPFHQDQRALVGYRSYKQDESQEGLSTDNLIRKEKEGLYSTPNEIDTLRPVRGFRGYRNPLYTTTTSTVKIRETFDRTIDDGNVYDKAGTGTDTGTGVGGETTGRSELTTDISARKQLNTSGIRRNGYQMAETTSVPTVHNGGSSAEQYSTRETFEERCEENYVVEEEKTMPRAETKELL
uniref:CX domain-containing protein n=1 Tax=Setaria digitata TaxID=48799 RepID=A0A915Q168_9BILA